MVSNRPYPIAEGSARELDSNRHWYVLKTKPRMERMVEGNLIREQFEVYLPMLKRRRLEPLFPGYMFLRLDLENGEHIQLRWTPGVSHILGSEGVPIPVSDELIEAIRARVEREDSARPADHLVSGDRVVVTEGPFKDVEGIFDRRLRPRDRCVVLMRLLGLVTYVEVDASALARR